MAGLLEVEVTTARYAERAGDAGADRIVAVRDHSFGSGSPTPEDVAAMRAATTIELRVLLRLRAGYSTDGGELTRFRGLVWSYLDAGADGFVFGFLTGDTGIDLGVAEAVTAHGDWPWTFDQAIDSALNQQVAWEQVPGLPRLDGILTGGAARGLDLGLDHVLALARDPALRRLLIAAYPTADQMPWLLRAGVTRFNVGRLGRDLDTDRLASWRRLID
jgi:copper homeostasis protein